MSEYDSTKDTQEHIDKVRHYLWEFTNELDKRSREHDASKLQSPEKEAFDEVTPQLRGLTYGSDEYKAATAKLGDALKHHYAVNSHHPEHHANGIDGMTLVDVVEMFCDWKAASERHADGDFGRSIQINRERFAMSDQLAAIFENTREWIESDPTVDPIANIRRSEMERRKRERGDKKPPAFMWGSH
jgi:hypothetical protein